MVDLPANMTTLPEIITYVNEQSHQIFPTAIMLVLWLIIFLALKNYETGKAFLAASFILLITSILLKTAEISTDLAIFIFFALTIVGIVATVTMNR